MTSVVKVILAPNEGPQTWALECPIPDLFYGGARGGGKGIFLLLDVQAHCQRMEGMARCLVLRKRLTDLRDMIAEWKKYLPKLGWAYTDQTKTWTGPDGSIVTMAYAERVEDVEGYQGWNLSYVGVDEAGQYRTSAIIDLLRGTLRVGEKLMRLTGNPGGAGHVWLKERYVDAAPAMTPFEAKIEMPDGTFMGAWRVFIPARLGDNPYSDTPEYRLSLAQAGDIALVKAWLDGDWNYIPAGGVFDITKINMGDPPVIERKIQGWDTAFTEDTRNDESACITMGRDESGRFWLLHLDHGHWHVGDIAKRVMSNQDAHKAWRVLAEGGGAGRAIEPLVKDARRMLSQPFSFELVPHLQDKISKNAAFAAAVNNGVVWVPKGATWWPYLRDQMAMFTGEDGRPDDCVDAGGVVFREIHRLMAAFPPAKEAPAPAPRTHAWREDQRRMKPESLDTGPRLMWKKP